MAMAVLLGLGWVKTVYRFLAVNELARATGVPDAVIMEGWVPMNAVQETARVFLRSGSSCLAVSGGNVEGGDERFASYAEFGAHRLRQTGIPPDKLLISAPFQRDRSRTCHDAAAIRGTIQERLGRVSELWLVTADVHGRRSGRIYRRVFGPEVRIRVHSVAPAGYNADSWWDSSNGVKTVVMESVSLLYDWVWPEK